MRIFGWLSLIVLFLLVVGSGCTGSGKGVKAPKENDLLHVKSTEKAAGKGAHKKVIYLLADSLMYQAIDRGLEQNKLPSLKFLIDQGQYHKNLVSSFPTMSVTIDSSLLTGSYPDKHRVPGLIWYSTSDNRMINYGTGPMEVVSQGVNQVLADALLRLNQHDLNPETQTIYERLERRGLKSGSINGLIYRGDTPHILSFSRWISGPTSLPEEVQVKGPDFLAFGAFSNPIEGKRDLSDGPTAKMGFNNKYAIEAVKYLVQNKKLPDFLFVYLPELDQKLHKNSPYELEGVIELDRQIGSLLQAFGSREKALEQAVILVSGDSGMTRILPENQHSGIDLTDLLNSYQIWRPLPNAVIEDSDELALAVNETMAYVYKLHEGDSLRQIASTITKDERIDFVAWEEDDGWIYVEQAGTSKLLAYRTGGTLKDNYDQSWTVKGESEVLDLLLDERGVELRYGNYPDALQRLSGALHSHDGEFLVVTAKQGYELSGYSSPMHPAGGGHGSLHKEESLVPLIISGTKEHPTQLRIVDLQDFIMNQLLPH
ncbi:MAG: alkaline phosphatase family protein [Candidatus Pristimantibacillus sp.]